MADFNLTVLEVVQELGKSVTDLVTQTKKIVEVVGKGEGSIKDIEEKNSKVYDTIEDVTKGISKLDELQKTVGDHFVKSPDKYELIEGYDDNVYNQCLLVLDTTLTNFDNIKNIEYRLQDIQVTNMSTKGGFIDGVVTVGVELNKFFNFNIDIFIFDRYVQEPIYFTYRDKKYPITRLEEVYSPMINNDFDVSNNNYLHGREIPLISNPNDGAVKDKKDYEVTKPQLRPVDSKKMKAPNMMEVKTTHNMGKSYNLYTQNQY